MIEREGDRLHDEVEAVTSDNLRLIRAKYEERDQLVILQRDLDESESMSRFEAHAFEGAEESMDANKEEYYTELLQAESVVQEYTG